MEKLNLPPQKLEMLKQMLETREKLKQIPKTREEAEKHTYKFWNKQPVVKLGEFVSRDGPIDQVDLEKVKQDTPYKLQDDFMWCSIDLQDKSHREEVAEFMDRYYVEDDFGEFRLHYSADFLKWAIMNSNYDPELTVGIRVTKTSKLTAIIIGVPKKFQINDKQQTCLEVNFLCIHPKLRFKGLAGILISELTRRGHLKGFEQAFFTSSRYLPTPITSARYHHRAINIKTLIDTGFTALQKNTKLEDVKNALKLPDKISDPKFRPLEEKDLDQCRDLLMEYLARYNVHPIFDSELFKHVFFDNKFVTTYVLEDDDGHLIDMISYYLLPSTVLKKNEKHNQIKEAYLFYYTSNVETPYRLVRDMLIVAKNKGVDVFNALEIMENSHILNDLKFEKGTGLLHFYLYNWRMKSLSGSQIALIPF